MQILAAFGGLVSVVVSWIVCGRLLMLARRTRQAPELLIGLGLLLVGGLWSPLVAVGRQATQLPGPERTGFVVAGALCAITGTICMALFNARVFRAGAAWAKALVAIVTLGLLGAFAGQTFGASWVAYARHEQGPWLLATWVVTTNYLWGSLEALRLRRMMARRLQLGLADPVVTDRMRLWVCTMGASFLAAGMAAACQSLGIPMGGTEVGLLLTVAAAVFAAACLWLVFLPPAAYLAWVEQRASAAA